jgi:septal ring factor EnvC (AmiA/AmiB activator)
MGKVKRYYLFGSILILFLFLIGASYDEILNDKNKQVEITRKEIEESKSLIRNNAAVLKNLENIIDSIQYQINSLDILLRDYQNEKFLSPKEIELESDTVVYLQGEVEKTQKSLQNKIVNLYKHGKNYELELLMSSRTPNEYLRRNEYLQKFAQSRKKEIQDLKNKRFLIEEKKKLLTLSTSSKRYYVETKRSERASLGEKLKLFYSKKEEIENESNINQSKISLLERELNNIKNFITNFSEHKKTFKGIKTSRINYPSEDLGKIKGTLNLPVEIGLIRTDFGENIDNKTASRFFNNGVDFSISKGSKVYAIANGTINLIGDVPYYGKVIIINHDNNYRTVYTVLDEVYVHPGDKVKLNQLIARSGETIVGQILHFEIWHEGIPLNPNEWLRLH